MPELLCRARDPLSWQISFVAPSLLWVARSLLCQGSCVVPGNLCITRNPWSRLITESRQGSLVAALGFLSHSAMAPWSRWPGLLDCASQGCLVSPGCFFLLDQTYSLKDPCTFSKFILSVSSSAWLVQNPDQLKCQFCAKQIKFQFSAHYKHQIFLPNYL